MKLAELFPKLFGGAVLGVLCCRVIDLKVVIAYSSVIWPNFFYVLAGKNSAPGNTVRGLTEQRDDPNLL